MTTSPQPVNSASATPVFQRRINQLINQEYGNYLTALQRSISSAESHMVAARNLTVDLANLTDPKPEVREIEIDKLTKVSQLVNDRTISAIVRRIGALHELDGVADHLFHTQLNEMLKGTHASVDTQTVFKEKLQAHYLMKLHTELFPDPLPLEPTAMPRVSERIVQDTREQQLLKAWQKVRSGNLTAKLELVQYEQDFFHSVARAAGITSVMGK